MKEAAVQRQVVDGLRARGAYVIITHDAKHRPVTVGVSDIIALLDKRVLFVECKGYGGSLSEAQMVFLAKIRELGHTAIVAKGWDDVECRL